MGRAADLGALCGLVPSTINVTVDDPILNLIAPAGGECASALYQSTTASLLVDELDASPLGTLVLGSGTAATLASMAGP